DPPERIRVLGAEEASILELGAERREGTVDAPAIAAAVEQIAAGGESKLAPGAADDGLRGIGNAPHQQVDAVELAHGVDRAVDQLLAALLVERVDHRRALRGAERALR